MLTCELTAYDYYYYYYCCIVIASLPLLPDLKDSSFLVASADSDANAIFETQSSNQQRQNVLLYLWRFRFALCVLERWGM